MTDLTLNNNVDKKCYIDGDVVKCHDIGNTFSVTPDGFPADIAEDGRAYILYENIFNDMPPGWDPVEAYFEYEEKQLTPWLKSMGFTDISWHMGEADSFGPLSRYAKMKRNGERFEFIYG